MILFGDIWDEIVDATRTKNNPEEQARNLRRVNQDQLAIAAKDSWEELRDSAEYTWASAAIQLPANVLGIDLVWDDTNGIEFLPRNYAASRHDENAYRYFTKRVGSALATVTDAAIQADGTVLNSPDLLASGVTAVGEWFYVEGSPQLYKITAAADELFTFTPAYKGDGAISGAKVTVRPKNTLTLELVALGNSTTLPTSTFEVHYYTQPDELKYPSDIVPFPTAKVLLLRTLSSLPTARQLRPIAQGAVDDALSEALSMNPDKPKPRLIKGIQGRDIDFGANHYEGRQNSGLRANRIYTTWQSNR